MAVDDFGLEVLKKAAEEVTPGDKSDYYIKTKIISGLEDLESFVDGLEALATTTNTLLTTIRDNSDQLEGYTDGIEALIGTTNTTLASIDAGIPATLGQATKANSMPVVLASNQTPPDFVTITEYLLNAGSPNMNVLGSAGSPVTFSLAPTSGLIYYVESLAFFLNDSGTQDYDDFGAIPAALTNGVLIRVKSKGATYLIATLKTNIDVGLVFVRNKLTDSQTNSGFFNDNDYFLGELFFETPMILQNSTADQIEILIQDDLTAIDRIRALIKYRLAS